jgi:hypothetical protein
MNTALTNAAKAAVDVRSSALAAKVLQAVNEGASAEHISKQIALHIVNVEWPAAAVLFVDMESNTK